MLFLLQHDKNLKAIKMHESVNVWDIVLKLTERDFCL